MSRWPRTPPRKLRGVHRQHVLVWHGSVHRVPSWLHDLGRLHPVHPRQLPGRPRACPGQPLSRLWAGVELPHLPLGSSVRWYGVPRLSCWQQCRHRRRRQYHMPAVRCVRCDVPSRLSAQPKRQSGLRGHQRVPCESEPVSHSGQLRQFASRVVHLQLPSELSAERCRWLRLYLALRRRLPGQLHP